MPVPCGNVCGGCRMDAPEFLSNRLNLETTCSSPIITTFRVTSWKNLEHKGLLGYVRGPVWPEKASLFPLQTLRFALARFLAITSNWLKRPCQVQGKYQNLNRQQLTFPVLKSGAADTAAGLACDQVQRGQSLAPVKAVCWGSDQGWTKAKENWIWVCHAIELRAIGHPGHCCQSLRAKKGSEGMRGIWRGLFGENPVYAVWYLRYA